MAPRTKPPTAADIEVSSKALGRAWMQKNFTSWNASLDGEHNAVTYMVEEFLGMHPDWWGSDSAFQEGCLSVYVDRLKG